MRFDQVEWWSCGHSASASLLLANGIIPPNLTEATKLLEKAGVKGFIDQGMSILHLGVMVFLWTNLPVQIYISEASLYDIFDTNNKSSLDLEWQRGAKAALRILEKNNLPITSESVGLSRFFSLHGIVPLVVCIKCAEYYRITHLGDEEHFLAMVPWRNNLLICDPYEIHGYQEISGWSSCLEAASEFNWALWRGDAFSIRN